jgi:hypothetical protein
MSKNRNKYDCKGKFDGNSLPTSRRIPIIIKECATICGDLDHWDPPAQIDLISVNKERAARRPILSLEILR